MPTHLVDGDLVLLDGARLDVGLLDLALNNDNGLGRDTLRVLDHLLGDLVDVGLLRDGNDTLESLGLLAELEEGHLGSWGFRQSLYFPSSHKGMFLFTHPGDACCGDGRGREPPCQRRRR